MKKEDVDKLTLQEACDYAIAKLVEQGCRCMEQNKFCKEAPSCSYGNDEGQHCAIGWLLDEEDPALMRFEANLYGLLRSESLQDKIPDVIKLNYEALEAFQQLHDARRLCNREEAFDKLDTYIDVKTNPNYQKWVDMGEGD